MTLLLRRKRPITAPNTRPAKGTEPLAWRAGGPFCAVAASLAVALFAGDSAAGQLKWVRPKIGVSAELAPSTESGASAAAHSTAAARSAGQASVDGTSAARTTSAIRAPSTPSLVQPPAGRDRKLASQPAAEDAQRATAPDTDTLDPFAELDSQTSRVVQTAASQPALDPFAEDDKNALDPNVQRLQDERERDAGIQPGPRGGTEPAPFSDDAPATSQRGLDPAQPDPLAAPSRLPQEFMPPLADTYARNNLRAEPCPSPGDLKPIREITNDISPEPGEFPQECGLGDEPFQPRAFALTTYTWKASALCHKPLYFEDVALERYGHTCFPILQPFISGGKFFADTVLLPYHMGIDPPFECVYALGYYRPGSCAPYMIEPFPISLRGAVVEGGVVTGLAFLIP